MIADEPTSALDALTQFGILQMLADPNRNVGTAVLYISHDLQISGVDLSEGRYSARWRDR